MLQKAVHKGVSPGVPSSAGSPALSSSCCIACGLRKPNSLQRRWLKSDGWAVTISLTDSVPKEYSLTWLTTYKQEVFMLLPPCHLVSKEVQSWFKGQPGGS